MILDARDSLRREEERKELLARWIAGRVADGTDVRLEDRWRPTRCRPGVSEREGSFAVELKDDLGLFTLFDRLDEMVAGLDTRAWERVHLSDDVVDLRLALVALMGDGGDGERSRSVGQPRELGVTGLVAKLLAVPLPAAFRSTKRIHLNVSSKARRTGSLKGGRTSNSTEVSLGAGSRELVRRRRPRLSATGQRSPSRPPRP